VTGYPAAAAADDRPCSSSETDMSGHGDDDDDDVSEEDDDDHYDDDGLRTTSQVAAGGDATKKSHSTTLISHYCVRRLQLMRSSFLCVCACVGRMSQKFMTRIFRTFSGGLGRARRKNRLDSGGDPPDSFVDPGSFFSGFFIITR